MRAENKPVIWPPATRAVWGRMRNCLILPGRGEGRHELRQDCPDRGWEPGLNFGPNVPGHPAIKWPGDAPGDGRDRVRIPAQGNRLPDGVLPAGRVEEGNDRLRDRPLARHVKTIVG